ncbi:MAG TPA: type II toxin-antitoxin system RelE/ParE family toxin [Kiritimatiellia bacterium]|nr:type II toxin-antitoxin system RelE/ParE family toxin [Kiritimatiellia bacterium]HQQ05243.1 type II toxin-antitoxin system RelE/ParE family toxin [Kiritimatiellia bacterium]
MARYEVVLRKSVLKDLGSIPKKDVARIMSAIGTLANNPRPPQSRKLSGQERYRLRQGVYRIIYSIEDKQLIVCVVKVGHRREVYR